MPMSGSTPSRVCSFKIQPIACISTIVYIVCTVAVGTDKEL